MVVRAGLYDADSIVDALRATNASIDISRFFVDEPFHSDDQTWVLSKMWGLVTAELLGELTRLDPSAGVTICAATT